MLGSVKYSASWREKERMLDISNSVRRLFQDLKLTISTFACSCNTLFTCIRCLCSMLHFWEISLNISILCSVLFKLPSEKKERGSYKCTLCWEASFTKKWVKHAGTYILNIETKKPQTKNWVPTSVFVEQVLTCYFKKYWVSGKYEKSVMYIIAEHVTTSTFYLVLVYELIAWKLQNIVCKHNLTYFF